jgi:hypothetical protein
MPPITGIGGFFMPEGGPMDIFSTLLLADTAVRIAILSLGGALLLSLISLGRQARRRS